MSYSYTRFRRVLAVVRITVGLIFLLAGGIKLFDPSFFGGGFITALSHISPLTPSWYQPIVRVLSEHPGWYAVAVGALELFLGLALVLGLATRPASFLGMFYMLNRMAITWYPGGTNPGLYEYMDAHVQQVTMLCLFVLFAVGHAGETWGLGAIYHHQRFEKQKGNLREHPEYAYLYEPERDERGRIIRCRRRRKADQQIAVNGSRIFSFPSQWPTWPFRVRVRVPQRHVV